MPEPIKPHSFTASANGLLLVLTTPCHVCGIFDPATPQPPRTEFTAIWDTGATASVITQSVVDACELKPVGMRLVHGVHGEETSETFLVNMLLPHGLAYSPVEVTLGKLPAPSNLLIGMDIISTGDFAVTNKDQKTVFSFRYPSQVTLDFKKEDDRRAQMALPMSHHGSAPPIPQNKSRKNRKR